MLHPAILATSATCHLYGITHAVLSPGSRNAPLTLSFARNDAIQKWIIPDERTAGFIGLGIAQKVKEPVILCCTSGTALLNYHPAIAEAFYREIPLIVLSADRPPELIDQRDGQTIRQFEVLKNHVKASFQLPLVENDDDAKVYQQQLEDALGRAHQLPKGPVHLNIPFREPFYPDESSREIDKNSQEIDKNSQKIEVSSREIEVSGRELVDLQPSKTLILIGQKEADPELTKILRLIESYVPVINSPLANLGITGIGHFDFFLSGQEELHPDVLITAGFSVLSKKLKNFLRSHRPAHHFHFDPAGVLVDTYATQPILIPADVKAFLKNVDFTAFNKDYLHQWKKRSDAVKNMVDHYDGPFSEALSAKYILSDLPGSVEVHLANSMSVRWADLFGMNKGIQVYSNRGTSGIDGCTSTAVGTSLVSKKLQVLITGDMAFLYDKNAFFHNYELANLRIIIFNNQGGGIFRLIEGPSNLPELEDYFETRHHRSAKYICEENGMDYHPIYSYEELSASLKSFYQPSTNAKVMEVFSEPETNELEFKRLKDYINEQLNQLD